MTDSLNLANYRKAIKLDEPVLIQANQDWQNLLYPVLTKLGADVSENITTTQALDVLHGLLATIDPNVISDTLVRQIETIALENNLQASNTESLSLSTIASQFTTNYPAGDKACIWVGDITKLKVDAIVNAANRELLGCRVPNHACIDNAIHSSAGPTLRDDCALIIEKLMSLEAVGSAKITRAYALPSNYVLHTVGPQLNPGTMPDKAQRQQLINTYNSCLDLAAQVKDIRSIAFCAISTGVFFYPKDEAANIALVTVSNWLARHPERFDRIIFNLYSKADAHIYEVALNGW